MKRIVSLAVMVFLVSTVSAMAQHPCDATPPTSGSLAASSPVVVKHCHSGVDAGGNAVTGFKIYDNGVGTALPMVKGSTPNAAGLFEYASPWTTPAGGGVHTITTSALSGTFESPKSNPFALTVSLPRVAPVAPTKTQVQ